MVCCACWRVLRFGVQRSRSAAHPLQTQNCTLTVCTTLCPPLTYAHPGPRCPLRCLLMQMRSTRNFVVDIVLICILLAIGLYLYNFLK